MKKWITLIFVGLLLVSMSAAQDAENQKLLANHNEMIKYTGDVQFQKATHYFAVFDNMLTSVYSLQDQKCVYTEYGNVKLYRVIICNSSNQKANFSFTEKIGKDQKVYTLKYSISFMVAEKSGGYFATIDKENSDILSGRADWSKIIACILKYGDKIYEAVKVCLEKPDFLECLKILGPAVDVYKCIQGEKLGAEPVMLKAEGDRAILTQTIYFSWSWGYSSGFVAPPVYKEMPNTIIGFDSVQLSGCKNAWNIAIEGTTAGNNVAKVVLARVTYMCYPTFWSSSVSGSIRCVMQK